MVNVKSNRVSELSDSDGLVFVFVSCLADLKNEDEDVHSEVGCIHLFEICQLFWEASEKNELIFKLKIMFWQIPELKKTLMIWK